MQLKKGFDDIKKKKKNSKNEKKHNTKCYGEINISSNISYNCNCKYYILHVELCSYFSCVFSIIIIFMIVI